MTEKGSIFAALQNTIAKLPPTPGHIYYLIRKKSDAYCLLFFYLAQ